MNGGVDGHGFQRPINDRLGFSKNSLVKVIIQAKVLYGRRYINITNRKEIWPKYYIM